MKKELAFSLSVFVVLFSFLFFSSEKAYAVKRE